MKELAMQSQVITSWSTQRVLRLFVAAVLAFSLTIMPAPVPVKAGVNLWSTSTQPPRGAYISRVRTTSVPGLLLAATGGGGVLSSADSGLTWSAISTGFPGYRWGYDVARADDGSYFAATGSGVIRLPAGASSWDTSGVTGVKTGVFYGVRNFASGTIVAAGAPGR
jgi:hypothetical protein